MILVEAPEGPLLSHVATLPLGPTAHARGDQGRLLGLPRPAALGSQQLKRGTEKHTRPLARGPLLATRGPGSRQEPPARSLCVRLPTALRAARGKAALVWATWAGRPARRRGPCGS